MFSGKRHASGVNVHVAADRAGRLLEVLGPVAGSMHDAHAFAELGLACALAPGPVAADLGYLGCGVSTLAGILNATAPLFTLLLAAAIGSERLSTLRIGGLVLGLAGVTMLAAPWLDQEPGSLVGAAACLAGAAGYGVSYVYAKRFLTDRGVPPLVLAASHLTMGAILLGIAAPIVARQSMQLSTEVALSVLVLGVFCTGAAYVLNYRLVQDDGPIAASIVNYLVPLVTVILGVVVLSEPITWNRIVGGALVLLSVALAEGPPGRRVSTPRTGLERARRSFSSCVVRREGWFRRSIES